MPSYKTLGDLAREHSESMVMPSLLCRFDGTIRAIAYSAFLAGALAQAEATPAPPRCLLEPEGDPPGGETSPRKPLPGSEAVSAAWKDIQPSE